jgi:hypothetical protein
MAKGRPTTSNSTIMITVTLDMKDYNEFNEKVDMDIKEFIRNAIREMIKEV